MADILVTGKKISDMDLATEINGDEKIPTGSAGDVAITPDQLVEYTRRNTNTSWGKIVGDIDDQLDLKNKFLQASSSLTSHVNNKENPHEVTKAQVGLGNVDNTSDLNKPVSSATQAALSTKADKSYVEDKLDLKADKSYVDEELDLKADLTSLTSKVDQNVYDVFYRHEKSGQIYGFDQAFSTAIGGYPLNSRLRLESGGIVVSIIAGNTNNPNSNFTGWKPDVSILHPSFFNIQENDADATEALRLMHTIANTYDIDVSYAGIKHLNVQANARISINTNTDFAGCRFDLLNGLVVSPTWNGSTYRLFIVKDPNRTVRTFSLNASELVQGATQVTVPEDVIEGYLFLESDKRIGNRTSAPSTNLYFKQSFTLSSGGILNYPLIKDLTGNTVTATLYNDPSKRWITIKGLYADISKFNNQCLLDVQRNYTRVTDFAFERSVLNTSSNANSLIWFTYCSVVVFENSRSVAPQIRDGVTTSGLSIGYCSDVVLRNLYGLDKESWGFTTTNFLTGLVADNCHIGRMDNHQGCMFWRIIGGSLHNKPIQYSWGGGFIDVDGTTIINKELILARNDYDNDFDGHISLRNIKWVLNDPASMDTDSVDSGSGAVTRYIGHIFSCYQAGTTSTDANGVIPIKLADSIYVENLEIIAPNIPEGQLTISAVNFDLIDSSAIVQMPHTIKIQNIHSEKNKFYFTTAKGRFYKAYPYYSSKMGVYTNTVWKFRDIDSLYCNGRRHGFIGKSGANEQTSAFTKFVSLSKTFQYNIENCTGVVIDYTMPTAIYRINNCDIGALNFGATNPSNANCTVNSSRLINTVRTEAGNGRLGQIGTGSSECKLNGVEVWSDVNPVFISSIIGTTFKTSVTVNWSSTLIPQLTYAQMFNGWYNAASYK